MARDAPPAGRRRVERRQCPTGEIKPGQSTAVPGRRGRLVRRHDRESAAVRQPGHFPDVRRRVGGPSDLAACHVDDPDAVEPGLLLDDDRRVLVVGPVRARSPGRRRGRGRLVARSTARQLLFGQIGARVSAGSLPGRRPLVAILLPVGAQEGDPLAVGGPREPLHPTRRRVECARLAAIERQQVEAQRALLGSVREEGQRPPVRRPGRRRIPPRSPRQLPRCPARRIDEPDAAATLGLGVSARQRRVDNEGNLPAIRADPRLRHRPEGQEIVDRQHGTPPNE